MSAWIVAKPHIDALVQSLVVAGLVPLDQATETGQMLWKENHRSVNYRYGERRRTPSYTFTGIEAPLDPVVMVKQCGCYSYQTCEHPGWDKSKAKRLIDALAVHLRATVDPPLRYVPDWGYEDQRYDDAPWGIDRIEQAIAVADVRRGA